MYMGKVDDVHVSKLCQCIYRSKHVKPLSETILIYYYI